MTVVTTPFARNFSWLEFLSALSRLFEWELAPIMLSLNLLSRLIFERAFLICCALDDSLDSRSFLRFLEDKDWVFCLAYIPEFPSELLWFYSIVLIEAFKDGESFRFLSGVKFLLSWLFDYLVSYKDKLSSPRISGLLLKQNGLLTPWIVVTGRSESSSTI